MRKAIAILLLASCIYGLDIIVVKDGLQKGIEPLAFSLIRTVLALALTAPYLISRNRDSLRKLDLPMVAKMAVIGIIAEGAVILLLFWGQHHTSAVNAGFMIRLTFLFTFPFAYLIVGERPGNMILLTASLMLGGAFLISTGGTLKPPMSGDLAIIGAALCLGFTNAYAKRLMRYLRPDEVTLGRFVFGSLFLSLIVLGPLGGDIGSVSWLLAKNVVLSAVLYSSFVLLFYRGVGMAGPNIAALMFTVGAVFSALFAVVLLGEQFACSHVAGAAMLIGGALLISIRRMAPPPSKNDVEINLRLKKG